MVGFSHHLDVLVGAPMHELGEELEPDVVFSAGERSSVRITRERIRKDVAPLHPVVDKRPASLGAHEVRPDDGALIGCCLSVLLGAPDIFRVTGIHLRHLGLPAGRWSRPRHRHY